MKELCNDNLFVADYSATQDCFHADTLKNALNNNRRNARDKRSVDYEIIAIVGSLDDALDFCDAFRERQIRGE